MASGAPGPENWVTSKSPPGPIRPSTREAAGRRRHDATAGGFHLEPTALILWMLQTAVDLIQQAS